MSDLNDPRVFFALERTLLAWNRTSLALMAFGFVIERFELFMHLLAQRPGAPLQRGAAFWVGIAFILLGSLSAALSIVQYRKVLRSLKPVEIPQGYGAYNGVYANAAVGILGIALTAYLVISA